MNSYLIRYYYTKRSRASGVFTYSGEKNIEATSKGVALSMLFALIEVEPYIVFFVEDGKEVSTDLSFDQLQDWCKTIREKR